MKILRVILIPREHDKTIMGMQAKQKKKRGFVKNVAMGLEIWRFLERIFPKDTNLNFGSKDVTYQIEYRGPNICLVEYQVENQDKVGFGRKE